MNKTGSIYIQILAFIAMLTLMTIPLGMVSAQRLSVSIQQSEAPVLAPSLKVALSRMTPGQKLTVIATLKGQPRPQANPPIGLLKGSQEALIRDLQSQAIASLRSVSSLLNQQAAAGEAEKIQSFWIINGFSLRASQQAILALSNHPGVQSIEIDKTFTAPTLEQVSGVAWDNLGKINAPKLWALGYRGQGVVVANLDTGVEFNHPELVNQWRGGTNSWYDPVDPPNAHPVPADLPSTCLSSGHGTATMGVMVGNTVGVAPEAKWIAVKVFDDLTCSATITNVLLGFQWLLDPDGNPSTADAPQVVNNSWGGQGCDTSLVFQTALQNLRSAGILPVFSAGNYGFSGTAYPANYPEAFSVGATDSQDAITSYSSRGPDSCVTPPATYPNMVAPGDYIRTAGLNGSYVLDQGTSFAAPHVAGTLALLLSAFPQGLSLQQQQDALLNTALDLGAPGPDNTFGSGRLDAYQAYRWLLPSAQLGFLDPSIAADETSGPVSLAVIRDGGIAFPVSVDVNVLGGNAVAGINYILANPAHLDFAIGETQKSIQIDLVHDLQPSSDKTLQLTLSNTQIPNPIGSQTVEVSSTRSQMTLTIVNTDPWVISFPMIVR